MKKLLLILLPLLMVMSCDLGDEEKTQPIDSQLIGTWTQIDENVTDEYGEPFESKVVLGSNTFEITQPFGTHKGSIVPASTENTVTLNTTYVLGDGGTWIPVSAFTEEDKEAVKQFGLIYENFTISYEVSETSVSIYFDEESPEVFTKQ